jgi:sigma-E factor negative regulatory protein RseB
MRRLAAVALAVALSTAGSVAAQGQADALAWLQKMYSATQKLNYTGTFIYQYGEHSETSRVTRLVENGNVYERVETLDGVPREVVRANDEVKWYLPTAQVVKIDRKQVAKPFPGMLPEQVQSLGAFYNVRRGDVERIAGYDSQAIVLEPRDGMRYAHKLWADTATGMLVKAKTFNEKGETLEQFFFTDLRIGGKVDREAVRSRYAAKASGWRVENLAMNETNLAQGGWNMKALPPGYAKVTEMQGTFGGTPSVAQIVLSDGLAAASVFIEPLAGKQPPAHLGPSRKGAMNVYTRRVEDSLVTVVGEMPAEGVRFIANQVEYRKPN